MKEELGVVRILIWSHELILGSREDVKENVNYDQKLWELSVDPGDKEFCQLSSQCAWTHL